MGSLALTVFVVGLVLYWVGYYVALVTAWRAGARGVATIIALMAGVCCCGGVAMLAIHWDKIQRRTFYAIANGGDANTLGARLSRFRIASAVAVVGMVLQLLAGYLLPDEDERDDSYSAASSPYSEQSHSDEPEEPRVFEPSVGEPAYDSGEAAEDETEGAQPTGDAVSGIVVGLSRDRRAAFVLDPGGGRWVRSARARIGGIEPGMTVHARGRSRGDGVLVVDSLEDSGIERWLDIPRPLRLEGELGSPPNDRMGRWVIVPNVRANSPTQLMASDGSALRVRAPAGVITRGAVYLAVRGALLDTHPIDRSGGVELWIAREEDVISAE